MNVLARWRAQPSERLAERISAATYGTVLVLAALALLTPDEVQSGAGWGLVSGVGLATYVAHAYAEVVGDHLRGGAPLDRSEVQRALYDGLPILGAAVAPAVVLGLGASGALDASEALWSALLVAMTQLVGFGLLVGWTVSPGRFARWSYGLLAAVVGVLVVAVKLGLSH